MIQPSSNRTHNQRFASDALFDPDEGVYATMSLPTLEVKKNKVAGLGRGVVVFRGSYGMWYIGMYLVELCGSHKRSLSSLFEIDTSYRLAFIRTPSKSSPTHSKLFPFHHSPSPQAPFRFIPCATRDSGQVHRNQGPLCCGYLSKQDAHKRKQ